MKKFILNNGLFLAFVVPQITMVIFAHVNNDVFQENDFSKALFFHVLAISLFIIGYLFANIVFYGKGKKQECNIMSTPRIKKFSYILIIIGVITAASTMLFFVGIKEYFVMLYTGSYEILELRSSAADGGISGLFKLFNYAPLAIYLSISSFLLFTTPSESSIITLKQIQKISLIASIIKVFFSLDRLTILAIFVVIFFTLLKSNISKLKILIYISIGIAFLGFITLIRQGDSITEFISLYSKLGLTNFQLTIDSDSPLTFNFANTFLNPLNIILGFISFPSLKTYVITIFEWNPAQYFMSYLYQDFGYLSLYFYLFFGTVCKVIEIKKNQGKLFFIGLYLFAFFVLITFITVPFIRAIESWLIIFIIFLISHFFIKKYHYEDCIR